MAFPRDHHTATLLDDGRVLVVGGDVQTPLGSDGSTIARTVQQAEVYDPETGVFSVTGRLAQARAGHTATRLADGRIVIIGGYGVTGPGGMAPAAEVFDPASGTFATIGTLGQPRAEHIASLMPDGRVLVAGGRTGYSADGYAFTFLGSAEVLDPGRGEFRTVGPLVSERADAAAAPLAGGRVLLIGGSNQFGTPHSVEVFDPATETFAAVDSIPSIHLSPQAALLPDGRIFIPPDGSDRGDTSVTFEPGTERVATATTSETPRAGGPSKAVATTAMRTGGTATKLADGRVLLTGGRGGTDNMPMRSADLFDPATGSITPTGSMAFAHEGHLAVLLPDGRVMLLGGDYPALGPEVYDPATGTFGPASPLVARRVAGEPTFTVRGLADGRIGIGGPDRGSGGIRFLDTASGQLGPTVEGCYWRAGAAVLPNGTILEGCGADQGAMIYDPTDGSSRKIEYTGELWEPIPLADGRVLAQTRKGGRDDAVYFSPTLVYDPATGEVTNIDAPGTVSPMSGTIAQLLDGRLLLVGGSQGNKSDALWLLDPKTWAFTDAGRLLAPRADPTVTVLDDGRVLVAGGAEHPPDRGAPVPPDAELIDPKDLPAAR